MDWQLTIVLAAIAGSAVYLASAGIRSWRRSKTGCGGGCGCSAKAATNGNNASSEPILIQDLKLRKRN